MTDEEIDAVQQIVNEKIRENIPVVIKSMSKDEAIAMGAMALFGEKYADEVRVVIMDPNYSIELCGGSHVGSTGEIGSFVITHESAVAAGVRRIEALSGKAAENHAHQQSKQLQQIREQLKHTKDIQKTIEQLLTDNASLQKKLENMEARQLVGIRNELLQKDQVINNISFIGDIVEVSSPDALKKLCLDLKHHLRDHVVVLCSNIGGKAYVALGISEELVNSKGMDANKTIGPLILGSGGGQKTLATAGGQQVGHFDQVLLTVSKML
jgi:alanyl-tRNA synthetase